LVLLVRFTFPVNFLQVGGLTLVKFNHRSSQSFLRTVASGYPLVLYFGLAAESWMHTVPLRRPLSCTMLWGSTWVTLSTLLRLIDLERSSRYGLVTPADYMVRGNHIGVTCYLAIVGCAFHHGFVPRHDLRSVGCWRIHGKTWAGDVSSFLIGNFWYGILVFFFCQS